MGKKRNNKTGQRNGNAIPQIRLPRMNDNVLLKNRFSYQEFAEYDKPALPLVLNATLLQSGNGNILFFDENWPQKAQNARILISCAIAKTELSDHATVESIVRMIARKERAIVPLTIIKETQHYYVLGYIE